MKKSVALLGSAMFFVVCVSLYLMLETANINSGVGAQSGLVGDIEAKVKNIEAEISANQQIIEALKNSINEISDGHGSLKKPVNGAAMETLNKLVSDNTNYVQVMNVNPKSSLSIKSNVCAFAQEPPPKTDIQMLDMFEQWKFDNPDGGVWKQGYDIRYSEERWKARKLKVIVIPHSHCDPGWIKTLEKYYSDQVRHILNLMVEKLEQHEHMRFIYAEMSFFTMWWNEIDENMKSRTKKLLESGRLEIVTGGWVMNDEANAHYWAMVDQMIEGNQWLLNNLGVKPKSGWAIDPFGHSPTMAYLLKEMGFDNMLIQRTHYVVKRELSRTKQLEFMWRQNWDGDGHTDMFCHMMPFYSYDVPHTCGPDPKICCQFDFKRLPGGRVTCPWHEPPKPITAENVAARAHMLLDQYRKKSTLYDTDVVLAPLGDDFRYDKPEEWDNQYTNYQKLFDYMNTHAEWNVEAKFGTLSDYFAAVHERKGTEAGSPFPVLSGDFYSYADRDDHYWSGYFTSRPFQKTLDRVLESYLRSADILYSLALAHSKRNTESKFPAKQLMHYLVVGRRNLGLFQHHDGITGTAKDHVVVDYGIKMLAAFNGLKEVLSEAAHFLMTQEPTSYQPEAHMFSVDEMRNSHDSLPEKQIIYLTNDDQSVVFYNSLVHDRSTVARIYVDNPHVVVKNADGEVIPTQVDPFWTDAVTYSQFKFKVSFVVTVPGLGLSRYSIRKTKGGENNKNTLAKISFYNIKSTPTQDTFEVLPEQTSITIENSDLKLSINKHSGSLDSVMLKDSGTLVRTQLSFVTYGTTSAKDKSGAYLFMPNGQARPLLANSPRIAVTVGPIVTEVNSDLPMVKHKIRLYASPGIDSLGVDILNLVDVRGENNKELVMRLETDVQNTDRQFYTDLNGYQMIRRKWYQKLPIQGNFYPMPSAAFLEDTDKRLTILSGQSLGVASLQTGWLEIVQDRTLAQDDNRGVGQGVRDNKLTPNRFRLLLEKRDGDRRTPEQPAGYLSLLGHHTSQELIYPVHTLIQTQQSDAKSTALQSQLRFAQPNLPCDLHLVNVRTLQSREQHGGTDWRPVDDTALILHKTAIDCSFPAKATSCQSKNKQIALDQLLNDVTIKSVTPSSLTLLHDQETIATTDTLKLTPMKLQAYRAKLS